jgi:hypothetical protein
MYYSVYCVIKLQFGNLKRLNRNSNMRLDKQGNGEDEKN